MDTAILKRSIKSYLLQLSYNVSINNALGRLDINKDAENIVAELLNKTYSLNLINGNELKQNYPAIDLFDINKKISVQVSSTINNDKIVNTCKKFINHKHYNYFNRLIMYFITDSHKKYSKPTRDQIKQILNHKLIFDFDNDIINNTIIGEYINNNIFNVDLVNQIEKFLGEKLALPNGGEMDLIRGYILPRKLNEYAGYNIDELVGRNDVLDGINIKFKNNNITLLTGLGGIGKTTVARAYLEKFKHEYKHLAYIDITTNIVETFLQRLSSIEKSFDYNINLSQYDNFVVLLQKLRTINKAILIIDNCNSEEELRILKPMLESLDWKVLITSRTTPKNFLAETIKVGELNPEDAYLLFTKFYTLKNDNEIELIKGIIQKAHYHTKLIILLSKTARNNPLLQLDDLANNVATNNYQEDSINILIDLNQEERTIYEFILALFKPEDLSAYEKHYIRFFSVLPSQEIPINHLYELFEQETNQVYLINTLNKLVEKGWIEKYSNHFYRIHPLVKLVTQHKLRPTIEECIKLIRSLHIKLERSIEPLTLNTYLPYYEAIASYFSGIVNKELGFLLNRMSSIYRFLAQYEKALDSNLSALKIFNDIHPKTTQIEQAIAQSYGYIMTSHSIMSQYPEALEFGNKCLVIQERILNSNHIDLATTYSNLSNIFRRTGKLDLGYEYAIKAINIWHPLYLQNHDNRIARNLLNAYSSLASIWAERGRSTGNNKYLRTSLYIKFRTLRSARRFLPRENEFFAEIYNNISLTYRDLGSLNKAMENLVIAIDIKRKIYLEDHPDLALGYYNMGVLLERMNKLYEAKDYSLKALMIQEQVYFPEHENAIVTKELISIIDARL